MKKFWNWLRNDADGESELYLDGAIASETWWGDEVTPAAFQAELKQHTGDVTVWINSPGGDVFAAAQIYTMLRNHPGKVTVKIHGIAASAASVVAMAGDTTLISPVGMLMIHNPSTMAAGEKKDMEQAIAVLEEVKESILNAYAAKTGLSRNRLAKMMDAETWLNANEAMRLGFVDGILIDLKLGKPRREAMTAIGRKTAMPLLGATLIAILSFLPIFLSPDTAGVYVRDLFIVLAVSLLLSWVLALVHVPLMADAWLGQPAAPAGGATLYDSAVYRWLRAALGFGLRHRWSSIAVALVLVGLVMVYSASMVKALDAGKPATDFFTDQLLYVVFGAACALFLWKVVPYRFWVGPIVWAVWAVAVALIFAVWLAGTDHYGAQRWLYIGPIGLQPSEFCKIAFILVAVRLVVDWRAGLVESRATMVRALIFIIAPIALMYRTQSDLGTTAICFVGILAVMWMGGVSRRVIFACLGVAVLGGLVAIFGTGYRSDRLVFMDPWNDGEGGYGTGYNIIRSYYALAEGGIFGVGLGNSHEKFQYLFASESDFIFAVIGEELGLVGALFVIGLFFCVLYAGLAIAERASDDIGAMIAGGATVMLVFQAFLNIACVIGVFPTTGKPLPFISSGGTSMIASFILVGLVLSVSAAPAAPSVYEQRRADLRLVRREPAPPAPSGRARSGGSSRSHSAAASGRSGSGRIDASARSRSARPSNRSNYRR